MWKVGSLAVSLLALVFSGCIGDSGGLGGGDSDPPEANITVLPGLQAPAGTEFTFDASGSKGGKAFFWNFGDGETGEGSVVKHTFDGDNGRFPVSLVATDSKGRRGVSLAFVKVGTGSNGAPNATLAADNLWVGLGESMTFTVGASDPDNDTLRYYWTVGPSGAAAGGDDHGGGGHDHSAEAAVEGPCQKGLPECMRQIGDSFSTTFDAPGIYVYHCHPHPWMKQTIIVEPGGAATPATSDIDNFRFVEPVMRVGVGTNLTWTNRDPLEHTATLEAAHAGTPLPETGPTVTWTPDALGDFMVMVMVRDEKPYTGGEAFVVGEAMPMLDVRVTQDPPARTESWPHSGIFNTTIGAPVEGPKRFTHKYLFAGNTTMSLAWTAAPAPPNSKMRLEIFPGTSAQGDAFFELQGTSPLAGFRDLPPGEYTFRVTPVEGVRLDWDLTIDVVYDVKPPSAGGAHAHH